MRLRGGADISTSLDELQFDAAVLQLRLADLIAFLPALQFRFLHGVHLEKAIKLRLRAPFAVEIVEVNRAGLHFDDRGKHASPATGRSSRSPRR